MATIPTPSETVVENIDLMAPAPLPAPEHSDTTKEKVTIVGAGLVGALLSILLAKRGYAVAMYERRPDMRRTDIGAGRSINLALSDRGWRALEAAGIADDIRPVAIPMKGRMVHNTDGSLSFQPYGTDAGQAIYSVSRGGLNMALMDLAESHPDVAIYFGQRCKDVNLDTAAATLYNETTGETHTVEASHLIGADGAYSAVRWKMLKTDRFDYSQDYLDYGYKELTIPPGENGTWRMEKNALHIWPRGNYMLIALPNIDGSFTCTLFFPFEGTPSFAELKNPYDVQQFFTEVFPDAVPLMPTLIEDFFSNPTSSLVTVRCYPWVHGKAALIGDAAHAVVPFYGQGMNAGFEDARVFGELLDRYENNWDEMLPVFQQERKPNADAIAELAVNNFIEMRDLVADPVFLLRKKIEKKIHELYPDRYLPLYSMVTFSDKTYYEALTEGKKQDVFMRELMNYPNVADVWDTPEFEERIHEFMKKY